MTATEPAWVLEVSPGAISGAVNYLAGIHFPGGGSAGDRGTASSVLAERRGAGSGQRRLEKAGVTDLGLTQRACRHVQQILEIEVDD